MKFHGNFNYWIQPHWLEFVLHNRGTGRPKEGQQPNSAKMTEEYDKAIRAGYRNDQIYFWMFDNTNFPFDISNPPFLKNNFHWWITKMLPGNFMPLHIDPHTMYQKNSRRFWIPLQDYESGHIFMYEDKVITDYKAGDVWEYENSSALHGAANIGHTTRVVLQISEFDT